MIAQQAGGDVEPVLKLAGVAVQRPAASFLLGGQGVQFGADRPRYLAGSGGQVDDIERIAV